LLTNLMYHVYVQLPNQWSSQSVLHLYRGWLLFYYASETEQFSGYAGSVIALCDVFYSVGNIMDSIVARNMFANTFSWYMSFVVAIVLPIVSYAPFLLFGTSRRQCWDQPSPRRQRSSSATSHGHFMDVNTRTIQ